LSALTSTNPLAVNAVPAISHTIAVAAAHATTPSSTTLVPNHPEVATDQPTQAIAARNKVEQRQLDCNATVYVDKLALELVNHPNSSFVSNLISTLRYSTRIGYLGPYKTWVPQGCPLLNYAILLFAYFVALPFTWLCYFLLFK